MFMPYISNKRDGPNSFETLSILAKEN